MNIMASTLFSHMCVGMMLYINRSRLSIDELNHTAHRLGISEYSLDLIVSDLVMYGIISAIIDEYCPISYSITEFGEYFFKKLCLENKDVAKLCKKIGCEKDETDDIT